MESLIEEPDTASDELSPRVLLDLVDSKLQSLIEESRSLERDRLQVEMLQRQLAEAIEVAESNFDSDHGSVSSDDVQVLEDKICELAQENERLTTLLSNARDEYTSFIDFIESEAMPGYLRASAARQPSNEPTEREKELTHEVTQLNEQLSFLQGEIRDLREAATSDNDIESRVQIDRLRGQLLDARHEVVELRLQCNEINARLARYQGPDEKQRGQATSWEERKEELLKQLEAETQAETPCDPTKVIEVHHIIKTTDAEIANRDREIADLRALLEEQANARDGMAIGVAGIAAMLESDEIVVQERSRLKQLHDEWEQKQREAEVEMALERAKLARERLELQQLRPAEPVPTSTDANNRKDSASRRGRWLARLGLRDD